MLQKKNAPTRADQFERIAEIYDFFQDLLAKHQVSKVGIEKLFFTKYNQNNAEFVYGIRAALMMLFYKKGIQVEEYTPIELKKYITGNGKADKLLVQKAIMRIFQLQHFPHLNDAADALALAYLAQRTK